MSLKFKSLSLNNIENMELKEKLIRIIRFFLLITIGLMTVIALIFINFAYDRVLEVTMEKADATTKIHVEAVISSLEMNDKLLKDGKINESQALENAKNIVRDTRYNDGSGYFWADLADGTNAVHIRRQIEGTNRYDQKDAEGNYFVRDTIAAGDVPGGSYFDFYFPKPNSDQPLKKRGFVKKFETYGWYIGSGNYEEDLIAMVEKELFAARMAKIISLCIFLLLGFIVYYFATRYVHRIAEKTAAPISACAQRLKLLAEGDLSSPVPMVATKDESGMIAMATKELAHSLKTVIGDLSQLLEQMANGNFRVVSHAEYIGDFRPLRTALENIIHSLSTTLLLINQSAEQVSDGSGQIASGAQSLSQGAIEQAGAIEDLNATISQVSAALQKNAVDTKGINDSITNIGKEMMENNEKMKRLVGAMGKIDDSSQKISQIIKTIEEIAQQTNMLSLNAAIEAARAGEAGRGFAVVAAEVGVLAAKTSEASRDTTALIESSTQSVSDGLHLANQAEHSFISTVESVNNIVGNIEAISQEAMQQSAMIKQIEAKVNQISSVVETNSAMAQQSASSSEEFTAQAQMLKELIGKFKLSETK